MWTLNLPRQLFVITYCFAACTVAEPLAGDKSTVVEEHIQERQSKSEPTQKQQAEIKQVSSAITINQQLDSLSSQEMQSESLSADNEVLTGSGMLEGEELFLAIRLGNLMLADVFAYKTKTSARLGLSTLFEVLDFPIVLNDDFNSAQGWYFSEDNLFSLTVSSEQKSQLIVTLGSTQYVLNETQFVIEDDLYVDAEEIEKWFDFSLGFDFRNMEVALKSRRPLPVEARLARKNKQGQKGVSAKESVLPWKESSYQVVSTPVIDTTLRYSISDRQSSNLNYSLVGGHDLAYFGSQYFVSGSSDKGLSDFRLRFSKESTEGNLLGPLKSSHYEFGDINPVSFGSGGTGGLSLGFKFSNQALNKTVNNNITDFEGDVQPGWDVELYRNSVLLDSIFSSQSGRYEFKSIELAVGDNQFELVFYGPQGQVRTENKQIYVDGNAIKQGEFIYSSALNDSGNSLIKSSINSYNNEEGWALTGRYDYGVTDWFSTYFGHSVKLENQDDNDIYALGGNLNFFNRVLLNFNYQSDFDLKEELSWSARTKVGSQAINMSYRTSEETLVNEGELDFSSNSELEAGFMNENTLGQDLVNNNDEAVNNEGKLIRVESERESLDIGISGSLYKGDDYRLNYQNRLGKLIQNEMSINTAENLLSLQTPIGAFNHALFWQESNDIETSGGSLLYQKSFGNFSTRFNWAYTIKPEKELTLFTADFAYPITKTLNTQLSLEHQPLIDRQKAKSTLSWKNDNFVLNSHIDYDSQDHWQVGISTNLSFGYRADEDIYFINKIPLTNGGSLLVRVFEDLNLNGVFDVGEPALKDVKVKALQNFRQEYTNEQGLAMLSAMPIGIKSDIVIEQASLPDPFLIPAFDGISVTPRRGFVDMLDVPIVMSSELEGSVYIKSATEAEDYAAYVQLDLLDNNNKLIATAESEFDGFYLFMDVRQGIISSE